VQLRDFKNIGSLSDFSSDLHVGISHNLVKSINCGELHIQKWLEFEDPEPARGRCAGFGINDRQKITN
jgi:hypothetical protein